MSTVNKATQKAMKAYTEMKRHRHLVDVHMKVLLKAKEDPSVNIKALIKHMDETDKVFEADE